MNQKYHVMLSTKEKEEIRQILHDSKTTKSLRNRCNILLMIDESVGKPPTQADIAMRCSVSDVTIYKTIKEYVTEGIKVCLRKRRKTSQRTPLVTGEIEARIVALACSEPPKGFARWSVRLLRNKVIELHIVESIGRETIRTTLKKHNLNRT